MSSDSSARFSALLRWLGLTLVVLFALQLVVFVVAWAPAVETFREVLIERVSGEAPMVLVGLLLMLTAGRLDQPRSAGLTVHRWVIGLVGAAMALGLLALVPFSVASQKALVNQVQQAQPQIDQQVRQLDEQKKKVGDPKFVDELVAQAEQSGQVPPNATAEQKTAAARNFIQNQIRPQLKQAEERLSQARFGRDLTLNQRSIAGTPRIIVLAIAFVLVALVAFL
ncbi:MAG: HpsJ family protein [Cyanobacteriota bacterium]